MLIFKMLFFRAIFAPACLSHEVITRKWVCHSVKGQTSVFQPSYLCTNSALLCPILVTGSTCRLKELPCPERCTAGTAASMTTGTIRLHPKVAPYIWLTAALGLTATPPVPPFETNSLDKRWTPFSFSCTWASMCRRWPSSRAWTPARYWACSAAAAKGTRLLTESPS